MSKETNPNDVIFMSRQQEQLEQRLRELGWHVILFGGVDSRNSFFEKARALPADPPMGPYPNWDGFSDSLSGGLIDFDKPLVAIVWRDAHLLRDAEPESFTEALDVFEQVVANQWLAQKRGHTRNRVRFFILGSGPSFADKQSLQEFGL
jgi:hypothetical protein